MLLRGSIAALAFALSTLTGSPNARADEAFLCGTDRVVYVKPGELEALKRTDPCIASYFGITLQPSAASPATVAAPGSSPVPPVQFKTLDDPEAQASNAAPRRLQLAQVGAVASVHRTPPVAAPGTDFRNVRLINGGPGSDGWYRHTL